MLKEEGSLPTESGPETIQRVLSSYEIGAKLRRLRMRKKLGLVELGKHTGLSASLLSQIENGKLVPTLPTLARIAMVFDVGLDYFFSDRRRRGLLAVVRAGERMRFPERPDSPAPAYWFEVLAFSAQEKSMQAYLAEFEPRLPGQVADHVHDGAEFILVLDGGLVLRYEGEETMLKQGDSVYFDASHPHAYRAAGPEKARAVVVTTPPRL
ncbi:MAG: helix-turn-helix domain-containing protein [Bryobacteraceae bacterium]